MILILAEVRQLLSETPGVVVQDNTDTNLPIQCQFMHMVKMMFL